MLVLAESQDFDVGNQISCQVGVDGALSCWGLDFMVETGEAEGWRHNEPLEMEGTDWESVAIGFEYACGLRNAGELWCWGRNDFGQLGLGTTSELETATLVSDGWLSVEASDSFWACGIRDGGSPWCWGSNGYGARGDDPWDYDSDPSPKEVSDLPPVAHLALGSNHACAIDTDDALWCWKGDGLGLPDMPVHLSASGSFTAIPEPVQVDEADNWSRVATTHGHTCALSSEASLWCFGQNDVGQIGDGAGYRDVPAPVLSP